MYPPVVDASSGKEVTNVLLTDDQGNLIDEVTSLNGKLSVRAIAYDSSRDDEVEVIEPVVVEIKSETDKQFLETVTEALQGHDSVLNTDDKANTLKFSRDWNYMDDMQGPYALEERG